MRVSMLVGKERVRVGRYDERLCVQDAKERGRKKEREGEREEGEGGSELVK